MGVKDNAYSHLVILRSEASQVVTFPPYEEGRKDGSNCSGYDEQSLPLIFVRSQPDKTVETPGGPPLDREHPIPFGSVVVSRRSYDRELRLTKHSDKDLQVYYSEGLRRI